MKRAMVSLILIGALAAVVAHAVTNVQIVEPTTASSWTLYDGNGTSDGNLWENRTTSTVAQGADVISVGSATVLELYVGCPVSGDGNSITLNVAEYSASSPAVPSLLLRNTQLGTGLDANRTVYGTLFLSGDANAYYAKQPLRCPVTPGSYVRLSCQEDLAGVANGPVFVRYRLTNQTVNAN